MFVELVLIVMRLYIKKKQFVHNNYPKIKLRLEVYTYNIIIYQLLFNYIIYQNKKRVHVKLFDHRNNIIVSTDIIICIYTID